MTRRTLATIQDGSPSPPMNRISTGLLPVLVTATLYAQDEALREKVNHALDSARPALMAHLKQAATAAARPGELALVLLAAIHDGVEHTDESFVRGVKRLADARLDQTYDLGLRLMVMELLADFPDREAAARDDAKKLLKNRDEGAFGYTAQGSRWDLSNTQYAALGLRAARSMGVTIDRSVWTRLAAKVGDQQDSFGGFGYQNDDRGFSSYASMTAAGIAVLAICRQALGKEADETSKYSKQIDRGWQWFARNLASIGSRTERWSYYFHYGLERAAILSDVEQVEGKSWYALGAEMLCEDQLPGGGWRSDSDGYQGDNLQRGRGTSVSTAFAILFLRRKFQKEAGPITPRIVLLVNLGPNSKDPDVAECAAGLLSRGKEAMPDVLHALRSDVEQQRRAAAKALLGIAVQDFGYDPGGDADKNREAIKKAELWYLRNR
ncbi:MAG: hypothetical protein U1E73_00570 [Planctomycetota bacterium]